MPKDEIEMSEGVDMKFRVTIEQDEDGSFITQCPSLPGRISEGKSREEVLSNVRDAIHGYLAGLKKHDEPIPPPIEEETVEVSA
jgi:predicted RNase H-like HicB family nuclease